jgi:hypothetical protein
MRARFHDGVVALEECNEKKCSYLFAFAQRADEAPGQTNLIGDKSEHGARI